MASASPPPESESRSEGGKDATGFDSTEEDADSFESNYEYCSDSSYDCGPPALPSLFNQEPVPCPICCEDRVEEGRAIVLPSCRHTFCIGCFTRCIEAQVGEGRADALACPHVGTAAPGAPLGRRCGAAVSDDFLRELLTPERYARLRQQRDAAFVRKNADYHHCPSPDCDNVVLCRAEGEGGARICDCFKCGQTSCLTCGARPFHFGRTCAEHGEEERRRADELARQRAEIQRAKAALSGHYAYAPPHVDRSRANEEARYGFELYGFELGSDPPGAVPAPGDALKNVRRCRRCGNGVELAHGCLKVKCLCGYRFCFRCGAENAQCGCTPAHHGFSDNVTGRGDFSGLAGGKSYT